MDTTIAPLVHFPRTAQIFLRCARCNRDSPDLPILLGERREVGAKTT